MTDQLAESNRPEAGREASSALAPFVGGGLGLAAFVVYALSAAPSVCAFGDSAELASAARALGLPHAPGYPLLTVLGYLVTHLPGDPDGLLNLTSAAFHALTVGLVFALVFTSTRSISAAIVGALSLALARSFFVGSLYYEAFPLADLFAAAVLLVATRIEQLTKANADERTLQRALCLLAALLGLAGAHHQMAILLVPSVLVIAGKPLMRALGARSGVSVILAGVVPFTLSIALVWFLGSRGADYERLEISSFSAFWAQITRAEYGGLLSSSARPQPWMPGTRTVVFGWLLLRSVGAPALVLAALGAALGARATRPLRAALALAFVLAGPLFFILNRTELAREENLAWVERFATLAHVPFAALVGLGLHFLSGALPLRSRPVHQTLATAALGLLTVLPAAAASHGTGLAHHDAARALSSDLLAHTEPDAAILAYGDATSALLVHMCLVEHLCLDREVYSSIAVHRPGSSRRQLKRRSEDLLGSSGGRDSAWIQVLEANASERPTYMSPGLLLAYPEIGRRFRLVPGMLLLRVLPLEAPVLPALLTVSERTRTQCSGCISLARPEPRPSMLEEHRRGYQVGLGNLVRYLDVYAPGSRERAPLDAMRASLDRTPFLGPLSVRDSRPE